MTNPFNPLVSEEVSLESECFMIDQRNEKPNDSKQKAIIFDLDGVIVDSEMVYLRRLEVFLETINGKFTQEELFSLVGNNHLEVWNKISRWTQHKYSFNEFDRMYEEFYKDDLFNYSKTKNKGIRRLIDFAKSKNYKVGLASCSSLSVIEDALNQCGIYDCFDEIISGFDIKNSKPSPEIYQLMAKRLNVNLENCLVIEDSNVGIEAGKKAGMKVIALREERFGFSQDEADLIVDDLLEIKQYL